MSQRLHHTTICNGMQCRPEAANHLDELRRCKKYYALAKNRNRRDNESNKLAKTLLRSSPGLRGVVARARTNGAYREFRAAILLHHVAHHRGHAIFDKAIYLASVRSNDLDHPCVLGGLGYRDSLREHG